MSARIGLIDYGMGNRRSAEKALEHVGARVTVSDDPDALRELDGLVLPGVGALPAGMKALAARGLDELIVERARAGVPVLGLCLGMQMLFERSEEHGGARGLGLLAGEVRRLPTASTSAGPQSTGPESASPAGPASPPRPASPTVSAGLTGPASPTVPASPMAPANPAGRPGLKLPHIGWSEVHWRRASPLAEGLPDPSYLYHVHSYAAVPDEEDVILATADYGEPFVAIVGRENVFGTQSHPEKSSAHGLALLANFTRLCGRVPVG